MTLLRSLVAHHGRSRARAWEVVGARGHIARVLRIARGLRIHLHLRLSGHPHERPVGGVLLHHMPTHLRPRAVHKLAALGTAERDVLHARTHAILRYLHLLWVSRHGLGLRTIHIRRHLAG